jgi:small subunit ribosomal protein S20
MPIIKSAKKRVKVASKAHARNTHTRRAMRSALKDFAKALEGGKPAEIAKAQNAATSALDVAAKKAVIHKNKAARRKAWMASAAKVKGAKPVKATSKPAPKKTTPKKTTAKKPAAKKTTTKSSTAKK